MELKGKTAIVTGAQRGIGEGIALVLARKGANFIVNDLKVTPEAEAVVRKITSMGSQAFAIAADVTKKDEQCPVPDRCVPGAAQGSLCV